MSCPYISFPSPLLGSMFDSYACETQQASLVLWGPAPGDVSSLHSTRDLYYRFNVSPRQYIPCLLDARCAFRHLAAPCAPLHPLYRLYDFTSTLLCDGRVAAVRYSKALAPDYDHNRRCPKVVDLQPKGLETRVLCGYSRVLV